MNADANITSITLTDGGTATLYLTLSQTELDTTALSEITNASYLLVVNGAYSVADFLANQSDLDGQSGGFAVSDTAANISANFDILNADFISPRSF